jgi:hypothetical protein
VVRNDFPDSRQSHWLFLMGGTRGLKDYEYQRISLPQCWLPKL